MRSRVVNGELKALLVAAVGEDLEVRVNHLTEDKLQLARALLNSAQKLSTHQEQTEWLAGQCEKGLRDDRRLSPKKGMATSIVAADTLLSASTVLPKPRWQLTARPLTGPVINGAAQSDVSIRKLRDGTFMIQTMTDIQSSKVMAISEIPLSNTSLIPVKVEPHRFLNVCKGVVTCYDLDCARKEYASSQAPVFQTYYSQIVSQNINCHCAVNLAKTSTRPVPSVSTRDILNDNVPTKVAPKLLGEVKPKQRSSPPPIPPRSPLRGPPRGPPPRPPRETKELAAIVGSSALVSGSPEVRVDGRREEIELLISSLHPSILSLQDTHFRPSDNPMLRGYDVYHTDKPFFDRASGGLAQQVPGKQFNGRRVSTLEGSTYTKDYRPPGGFEKTSGGTQSGA
uniref:Uncharacterized protein n=1 Tax=Timema genevievae TaxID=629358 RepID=A0A7R9K9K4_TIMGE|nr:unnamed protein product [Timema genevievae]